jgi:hypothetical protein
MLRQAGMLDRVGNKADLALVGDDVADDLVERVDVEADGDALVAFAEPPGDVNKNPQ